MVATSLNFADVAFLRDRHLPGAVPGFDASGVVVAAAGDGSGPPQGTRVATFGWSGGWAELRAVDTGEVAVVPDRVELAAAAAVPVAGVTALRRLRASADRSCLAPRTFTVFPALGACGAGPLGPRPRLSARPLSSLIGRRVLITGASGGVGRFAVQLAARAGAHVVASVGSPERGEGLAELGAAEVVVGLDPISEPVYSALDNVGGRTLAGVYALLEPVLEVSS